jgi:putative tricarboxylic transport membrane protein
MKKDEIVFFAVGVVFFSVMLYESLALLGRGRFGEMGSGLWPLIALGVCTVLSLVLLISSIQKYRRKTGVRPPLLTAEAMAEKKRQRTPVASSVLCFLAYLVTMPTIGFILATFLFIPALALALGERRRSVLMISPFLLTAIIVAVFAKFITIPFPKGTGVFAAFSRLFY